MSGEYFSMDELSAILGEQLDKGGRVRLTVSGMSMYPMLRNGIDSVVLEKAAFYKKGDIPLYIRPDGSYILHRIVGKNGEEYTLCGDNQMDREEGVSRSRFIAKVAGFYRRSRYVPVSALWYRFYTFLWVDCFRLRPFFARIIEMIRKIQPQR